MSQCSAESTRNQADGQSTGGLAPVPLSREERLREQEHAHLENFVNLLGAKIASSVSLRIAIGRARVLELYRERTSALVQIDVLHVCPSLVTRLECHATLVKVNCRACAGCLKGMGNRDWICPRSKWQEREVGLHITSRVPRRKRSRS